MQRGEGLGVVEGGQRQQGRAGSRMARPVGQMLGNPSARVWHLDSIPKTLKRSTGWERGRRGVMGPSVCTVTLPLEYNPQLWPMVMGQDSPRDSCFLL